MSGNHGIAGVSKKSRHSLTPKSTKPLPNSKHSKGSPIMQKLTSLFKRDNKETGHIPVRPACFADSPERRRSESPEATGSNRRKNGSGNAASSGKKSWKSDGGKDATGVGWRPKGRLEWESDSGRQITVEDIPVNELSKVETHALQRVGISVLQGMDIPVSQGLLRGYRNVFPRISFNTFKQRKIGGNEKQVEVPPGSAPPPGPGVFGQPLDQVVSQDQPPAKSGCGTPIPTTPTSFVQRNIHYPSSTSPTSTTSSETSYVIDPAGDLNSTGALLESLNISPAPPQSPRSKRKSDLCPAERQVPSIVTKAINYLDTKGVKTEGLFRISGAKSRINEIREKFDSGEDVELTDDMNPHDVACLLKEFFRSLPEPLMTVELYAPFLATRKLSNPGQRRDALRLLCLLLPQANRDTLQELLTFLSRVALHSDGIILIDGTEEVGNRMTEQNLAMIMGPNILHKEIKRKGQKTADYQVQKQDPDELSNVCKVMEDLIRMQLSIFKIPAKLYDDCLKALQASDPAAVDLLLKRRCYEQGLFLEESPTKSLVSRSHSTGALRKLTTLSGNPGNMTLEQELQEQEFLWQRTHSLSDTQKVLDEAIKNLEEYITEDLASLGHHGHYSSNDSAMGGSELVVSPIQPDSAYSEPATLDRKRQAFHSTDSAFSNNSSPTNSNDGRDHPRHAYSHTHSHSEVVTSECPHNHHVRMLSEVSNASTGSPAPPALRPTSSPAPPAAATEPHIVGTWAKDRGQRSSVASLPGLAIGSTHSSMSLTSSNKSLTSSNKSLTNSTSHHTSNNARFTSPARTSSRSSKNSKKRSSNSQERTLLDGAYSFQRSPILASRERLAAAYSESKLDSLSSDHTPTESAVQIISSPSKFSLDSHEQHSIHKSTVI